MFAEPTELLLIGYSIESLWTPKSKSNIWDTKNQLADMLTKGHITHDEWNHHLCLSDISHFSSAECSEVMSKRTQKESGEERVTAKSRPTMSLIARSNERAPSALSSTASESPMKTRHESQSPLSSQVEKYDRTGRPVVCPQGGAYRPVVNAHSSSYSEWNVDKTWSSQEWKSPRVHKRLFPESCVDGVLFRVLTEAALPAAQQRTCQHARPRWLRQPRT